MAVTVADPGEGGAKEIIDLSHEIDGTAGSKVAPKTCLLSLVNGVVDKIVNIHLPVEKGARGHDGLVAHDGGSL